MLIPDEIIFASRLIKGKFICFAVAVIILSGISGRVLRGIVPSTSTISEVKLTKDNPLSRWALKNTTKLRNVNRLKALFLKHLRHLT
jgi:hypothetical protein